MYCESWIKPFMKPFVLSTAICCSLLAENVHAGPLIDWLFGRRNTAPAYPVGQAVPLGNSYSAGYGVYPRTALSPPLNYTPNLAYGTNYGAYYGSQLPVLGNGGAAYPAPAPSGIAAATLPPTLSYVPNFRTNSYRAPVTYYRPLMTTDPSNGSQVVAMAPCTSYEYQASREPIAGRSAFYGPSLVPQQQPAPQALPTYTLPSGGIPLASNYPTTNYGSPYSTSYGGYSALQPASDYPSSPYYGSVNGGSTGSYLPSTSSSSALGMEVPGLSAPQAGTIRRPAPTYGQVVAPPAGAGDYPASESGGVYPAPSGQATDPRGDVAPSLDAGASRQTFPIRPQLRASESQLRGAESQHASMHSYQRDAMQPIPRRPFAGRPSDTSRTVQHDYSSRENFTNADAYDRSKLRPIESHTPQERGLPNYPKVEVPSLSSDGFESGRFGRSNPFDAASGSSENSVDTEAQIDAIPVPDSFEMKPRWSPGLLREEDMTALRPIAPEIAKYAGQAKKIRWASFEDTRRSVTKPVLPPVERDLASPVRADSPMTDRPQLRNLGSQYGDAIRSTVKDGNRTIHDSPAANKSRYSTQGWKSSR